MEAALQLVGARPAAGAGVLAVADGTRARPAADRRVALVRERVHGEVYGLDRPAHSIEWLDAYEGLEPRTTKGSEYERVARPVRLASGAEITAWVYLYRADVAGLQALADGRWVPETR